MPGLCPGGKTAAVRADLLPAWASHEKCISSDKSCDSPILPRHIMWLCAQTNNINPGIFRAFAWLFLNYVLRMTVHFSRKVLWPSNFVTKSLTTVQWTPKCFYSQGDLSKNMLRKFWLNGERGKVLLSQNWFSSKVFPQLQQFTQFTANCLSCPNICHQLQYQNYSTNCLNQGNFKVSRQQILIKIYSTKRGLWPNQGSGDHLIRWFFSRAIFEEKH